MLNTQSRAIYLEELKPPEGFTLDRAIATTFTLDLLTLLMAPLSMSLLEVEKRDEVLKDPLLVLEALRETTGKLAIFCHDGYISVPKNSTLLYSFLEAIVVPVKPISGNGVFHPKVWIMRFKGKHDSVLYRFLCLSRNLTFDKSWDTVLKLEGSLQDRQLGFSSNKPLYDFLLSLKDVTVFKMDDKVKKHMDVICSEIRKVKFNAPPGFFKDIKFIPSGIENHKRQSVFNSFDRCMIMSPFLSDKIVEPLARCGSDNILISRIDSVDSLSDNMFNELEENTSIYIMDESAEIPDVTQEENNNHLGINEFHGLHAKIFIAESGWDATVLTGSANATRAAFYGDNIEFMTHLRGRKSVIGINQFLGNDKNPFSFINLLKPYVRSDSKLEANDTEKNIKKLLEDARNEIVNAKIKIIISEGNDSTYSMTLRAEQKMLSGKDVKISCYPISLKPEDQINIITGEKNIVFKSLSLQSLTSFIVFISTVTLNKKSHSFSFVQNLPVTGMPEERDKKILLSIIKDKGKFLRYLLLILSDTTNDLFTSEFIRVTQNNNNNGSDNDFYSNLDIPLLEELLKAFSRNPDKIERIASLVNDVLKTEGGKELIPDNFLKIWKAFMEASGEEVFNE